VPYVPGIADSATATPAHVTEIEIYTAAMATYINGIEYECSEIDSYAAAMAANVCEMTSRGSEMIASGD
jgi:hypothetical protein